MIKSVFQSKRFRVIFLFVFILFSGFCSHCFSQAGFLDQTFGSSGRLNIAASADGSSAQSIIVQKDGRIVTAGTSTIGFGYGTMTIYRHNSNGTLDGNFKGTGKVTIKFAGQYDSENASDIGQQADGKLVVVGSAPSNSLNAFAIARIQPTGYLDSSFGSVGKVLTNYGTLNIAATDVEIQSDKKIVVAGQATGSSTFIVVARYDTTGALDPSFGLNGFVKITAGASDYCTSLKIQNDGKILVGGYTSISTSDKLLIIRLKTNGNLDTTFGNSGKKIIPIGTYGSHLNDLALQIDGKIVAAGNVRDTNYYKCMVARLDTTGMLDPTFASGGILVTHNYKSSYYEAVTIQPDGKIVAGGKANYLSTDDFLLSRFDAQGNADLSFGVSGDMTTNFYTNESCHGIALEITGKIVAAGGPNFLISRYNSGLYTGLTERNVNGSLQLFPNPASNFLTVRTNFTAKGEVMLQDLTGRIVHREEVENDTFVIDVSKIAAGIYFVTLLQHDQAVAQGKLVTTR